MNVSEQNKISEMDEKNYYDNSSRRVKMFSFIKKMYEHLFL